jgi:hypothetical protein
VVGSQLFEVKTHLAGESPSITISTAEQLWGEGNPLCVVVISLARVAPASPTAVTLPTLIEELVQRVAGTAYADQLDARLQEAGYVPVPEYADAAYAPATPRYFDAREGFPLIPPSAVPPGVDHIRYAIRLAACEEFLVTPDWERIKENAP